MIFPNGDVLLDPMRSLERLPPRVSSQHGHAATRDPRPHIVGTRRKNDGHSRAEHQACAIGIGQKAKKLGKDVGRLEVRREKNVGITGYVRVNSLSLGSL